MQHSQAVLPHHATLTGSALQGSIHYAVPVHDLRINRPHRLPTVKNHDVPPAIPDETRSEQHLQPVPLLQPRKPKRWRKWNSQQQHHTSARPLPPLTVSSTSDVDVLQDFLQQQQTAAESSQQHVINHWTDRPFPGRQMTGEAEGVLVDQQHRKHRKHASLQPNNNLQPTAAEQYLHSIQSTNDHVLASQDHQSAEQHNVSPGLHVTQLYMLPAPVKQYDSHGRHLAAFKAYYSIGDSEHWHSIPFLPIQTPSGNRMLLASIPHQPHTNTQNSQPGRSKHRHRTNDQVSGAATIKVVISQTQGASRHQPAHPFTPGPDAGIHEFQVGSSYLLHPDPSSMPQQNIPLSIKQNATPHTITHTTDSQDRQETGHSSVEPVAVAAQPLLKQPCMLVIDLAMLGCKQGCNREDQQCVAFRDLWQASQTVNPSMLVYTSHRSWKWFHQTWRTKQHVLQQPDVLLLSNGTCIMYQAADGRWHEDTEWKAHISRSWDRPTISQAVQSAIDLLHASASVQQHEQTQLQHQHQHPDQQESHILNQSPDRQYHPNINGSSCTQHNRDTTGGSCIKSNGVMLHPEIAQVLFSSESSSGSEAASMQQVPLVLHSMLSAEHQELLPQTASPDLAGTLNGHSLFCNGYELQHVCAGGRELVAVGTQRSPSGRTSTILASSLHNLLDTAPITRRAAVSTVSARIPTTVLQRVAATDNGGGDGLASTRQHDYHDLHGTGYAGQLHHGSFPHTGTCNGSSNLSNPGTAINGLFGTSNDVGITDMAATAQGRAQQPATVLARLDTFSEQNSCLVRVQVKRNSVARFKEVLEQQLSKVLRHPTHRQQDALPVDQDNSVSLPTPESLLGASTNTSSSVRQLADHATSDNSSDGNAYTPCSSSTASTTSHQYDSGSPAATEAAAAWEVVVMDSQGLGLQRGHCIVEVRPRRAGAGNALRYIMKRFGIKPNRATCPVVANMTFPQPDLQAVCTHAVVYEKDNTNSQLVGTCGSTRDVHRRTARRSKSCTLVTTNKWGSSGIVDGWTQLQLL